MAESPITLTLLTPENFTLTSLDDFDRFQAVEEVWRLMDGAYQLVRRPFTETWSPQRRREKAAEILSGAYIVYGAMLSGRVVGEIMLEKQLRGTRLVVSSLHVDQACRRMGIGKLLFHRAMEEGRHMGAAELYLSACSAKESIAFYQAMGCVLAEPVIPELAQAEPFDLQMVCPI
ncbi:MAG: GNAT family N-acetyltransferase [Aristaeellaceae bacterium]